MSEDALNSLVEQRIAQLAEISEKRNALLREMYRMMRKRTNVRATVSIDDEEEDDLHVFLKNHDLQEKHGIYQSFIRKRALRSCFSRRIYIPPIGLSSVAIYISRTCRWSSPKQISFLWKKLYGKHSDNPSGVRSGRFC
ncbi:hypothetical protein GGU10DRAFT_16440 [Lentinula aff. detonsa]|uniref:Uncharacterized protein n=1 Tax=Lentinula aff. detonsa TaxID=2804958 RepID=A0AA38NRL9_9AGAR|nr:hypothetical protein GGU10DRAFT_16440 [Lentinula aff. detonsa]